MASLIFGGIYKCAQNPLRNGLCKVSKCSNVQQVAFLSRKEARINRPPRPPPFPFKEKSYKFFNSTFDPVLERYDDNTKLIVVEGPPTAGKTELAAQIAQEFDMLHIPPDPTAVHTDVTGRDLRYYTKPFPEPVHILGIEDVLTNPRHRNVAAFQFGMYHVKFLEYVRALLHVLLNGQGVVMESSVYSHFVYMEAMIRHKYISKKVMPLYEYLQERSHPHILLPHVVIYLDVPTDEVQQRIKKRNIPYEAKSELLTKEFLSDVDKGYQKLLKYISPHSHICTLDMTKEYDVEDLFGELETADLYSYTTGDTKMRDWIWETEQDLKAYILSLTEQQHMYPRRSIPPNAYGIPELQIDAFHDYLLQNVRCEKDPKEILNPDYINKIRDKMEQLQLFTVDLDHTYDPFDIVQRAERYKNASCNK